MEKKNNTNNTKNNKSIQKIKTTQDWNISNRKVKKLLTITSLQKVQYKKPSQVNPKVFCMFYTV